MAEIEVVIAEYGDYLLKVAYLYVKNRTIAEDIVQDALFEKVTGKSFNKSPELEMIEKTEKWELVEALFTLTVIYREVLILYYFEELNTVEIAKLLECNEPLW